MPKSNLSLSIERFGTISSQSASIGSDDIRSAADNSLAGTSVNISAANVKRRGSHTSGASTQGVANKDIYNIFTDTGPLVDEIVDLDVDSALRLPDATHSDDDNSKTDEGDDDMFTFDDGDSSPQADVGLGISSKDTPELCSSFSDRVSSSIPIRPCTTSPDSQPRSQNASSSATMKLLSTQGGLANSHAFVDERISSSYHSNSHASGLSTISSKVTWKVGSCTKRGVRSSNEDRFVVVPDLREEIMRVQEEVEASGASVETFRVHSGVEKHKRSTPYFIRSQKLQSKIPCMVNTFDCEGARCVVDPSLSDPDRKFEWNEDAYFAVYDGHCGDLAAIHLTNHLHLAIARHSDYEHDLENAIIETCALIDTEIVEYSQVAQSSPGTTVLGVFLRDHQLTLFDIGDCQAIICRGGVAVEMAKGHKPGIKEESERIAAANGWITEEK